MDNVYILNIFLIFSLLLVISLFSSYYLKLSRFTTRLERNLEYGCDDIKRLEYTDIDDTKDSNIVLYIVDKIYESVNDNKDITTLIDASFIIKNKINDKDGILFGLHLTKGGKDYIIFRGSSTKSDWTDIDIDIEQTKYTSTSCVHSGFYRRFKEIKPQLPPEITSDTIVIGGHSLGSPIAIFTALHYKDEENLTINTIVFALPRMGNKGFSDNHITTTFNTTHTLEIYHNEADIIPQLPFTSTLNFDDKKRPFIYVNFKEDFYYDFYDARKYICSNHATRTYFDNIDKAIPRSYDTEVNSINCS